MKKVLFGLIVLAGFAACTSDDVVISDSTGATSLDGATTYLTVSINDVNTSTRATSSGFTNATDAEYAVNNAYFYFYDEDGLFVSRAEVWDGYVDPMGDDGANIQWKSNTVVVLKGLTDKKFPKYMVTVLNEPAGFETGDFSEYYDPAGTLAEMETKLAYGEVGKYNDDYTFNENAGIVTPISDTDYFVMSTTSYITDSTTDRAGQTGGRYFVTEVFESDFFEEPITAGTATPIEVYVERLAAKVQLTEGENAVEFATDADGTTANGYKLTETIAGEENWQEVVQSTTDATTGDVTSEEKGGVDDIYIVIEGWKLNSTARQSYIMKNLDENWADAMTWADDVAWNDASNHRSYWGKAYLYGQQGDSYFAETTDDVHFGYAVSSDNGMDQYTIENQAGNYDADEISPDTWLNSYVKYTSLADANAIDSCEYCAENTNSADKDNGIINNANSSAITSALIKARAYSKSSEGEYYIPQSLISFEGMLFTDGAFSEYIFQRVIKDVDTDLNLTDENIGSYSVAAIYEGESMGTQGGATPTEVFGTSAMTEEEFNAAVEENYGVENYSESLAQLFSSEAITWVNKGNGNVDIEAVVAESDSETTGGQWTFIKQTDADGNIYYTFVENMDNENEILGAIASTVDGYNENYEIMVYANGLMYYSVPIEHLNNSIVRDDYQRQTNDIQEAQYGVVRNHWYELTVNGVTKMGKAIVDENEVIVPDPSDPTYYYVEANINVLAWKNVTQDIIL